MGANRGTMILDRDLDLGGLEIAVRIATNGSPFEEKRRLLTVALRDVVSSQEAQGKTKKCLTRIWVNPPDEAREFIGWALEHQGVFADRRTLHLGALLGTFPMFGTTASVIGRQLTLNGEVQREEVRHRVKAALGDRSTIDVGARKAYTTLLNLGVLVGGPREPLRRGTTLVAGQDASTWLIHALLLTRGVDTIDASQLSTAPELFWVDPDSPGTAYPHVAEHHEGVGRIVWERTRT